MKSCFEFHVHVLSKRVSRKKNLRRIKKIARFSEIYLFYRKMRLENGTDENEFKEKPFIDIATAEHTHQKAICIT